jgi:cytidine deaminase
MASMTTSRFENLEDEKLLVLATATRRRTGAKQAAALRDSTGRTYVGMNIESGAFVRDAIESAFTIALTSQIAGIESVVIVGSGPMDIAPLREFAPECTISFVQESGEITPL